MKVPVEIKVKYIRSKDKAVQVLRVFLVEDLIVEAGSTILISPTDPANIEIKGPGDNLPKFIPYYVEQD